MLTTVKAFCRNPRHKRPPVVGWYRFSAPDNVWERTDDGGSDRDIWPVPQPDGTLMIEARPTFTCPCGRTNGNGYKLDTIEKMIHDAAATGERLWVL